MFVAPLSYISQRVATGAETRLADITPHVLDDTLEELGPQLAALNWTEIARRFAAAPAAAAEVRAAAEPNSPRSPSVLPGRSAPPYTTGMRLLGPAVRDLAAAATPTVVGKVICCSPAANARWSTMMYDADHQEVGTGDSPRCNHCTQTLHSDTHTRHTHTRHTHTRHTHTQVTHTHVTHTSHTHTLHSLHSTHCTHCTRCTRCTHCTDCTQCTQTLHPLHPLQSLHSLYSLYSQGCGIERQRSNRRRSVRRV